MQKIRKTQSKLMRQPNTTSLMNMKLIRNVMRAGAQQEKTEAKLSCAPVVIQHTHKKKHMKSKTK